MIFENFKEYIEDKELEYSIDKNELFVYSFVFIIIVSFTSKFNVTLSTILGLVFGYFMVTQLVKSSKNSDDKQKEFVKKKFNHIRPKEEIIEKYDDVINFLFSIQGLYVYNPPTYEEMVNSIKNFFYVYEESIKIPELAHQNYVIAEMKFYYAINLLHSIIINADGNRRLDNKINRAFRVLYKILKKYLDEIELIIKKDIKYNGYNVNTLVLDQSLIKPYNFSEFSKYTFDMI
jgi:hypothetical protein